MKFWNRPITINKANPLTMSSIITLNGIAKLAIHREAIKEQSIIEYMLIKQKLRTFYFNFKDSFNTEILVKHTLSRSHRSFQAQLRLSLHSK